MSEDFSKTQAQISVLTGSTIPALQAALTKLIADVPAAIQAAAESGAANQPAIDAIASTLEQANASLGSISDGLTQLDASLQPVPTVAPKAPVEAPVAAPVGVEPAPAA